MSRVRAQYPSAGYEGIHMFPARQSLRAQRPSSWIYPLLTGGSENCGPEFLSVCLDWTHEPSNQLDNKLPGITSNSLAEAMLTSIYSQIGLLGEECFGSKNMFILFSLTKGVSSVVVLFGGLRLFLPILGGRGRSQTLSVQACWEGLV